MYLVIKESENKEVDDIDLLTEIIDDKAILFENVVDILSWHEDEEDLSECKILKVKVENYYKLVNNCLKQILKKLKSNDNILLRIDT